MIGLCKLWLRRAFFERIPLGPSLDRGPEPELVSQDTATGNVTRHNWCRDRLVTELFAGVPVRHRFARG